MTIRGFSVLTLVFIGVIIRVFESMDRNISVIGHSSPTRLRGRGTRSMSRASRQRTKSARQPPPWSLTQRPSACCRGPSRSGPHRGRHHALLRRPSRHGRIPRPGPDHTVRRGPQRRDIAPGVHDRVRARIRGWDDGQGSRVRACGPGADRLRLRRRTACACWRTRRA